MTRSPLRLTLPATPIPSREQLRTVLPRQLWPELGPPASGVESSGPLLFSFHGTTFMDTCFSWLAGEADLPPQRAWRDWCEPPLAMLARSGTAAYPATVRRGRPWGLQAEGDPSLASALASDGVPAGTPPWLRKLYLPQHDRFTVVMLELICQAAGWPPLDRQRVKEAGLLVRRLRRSDPAGAEVWEDWIASDPRQGRWEAPPPEWEASGRDPAARPGLASQPLALAPVTLAGVGKRCLLHGYLSLTSAEQEVPAAPLLVDTRANAAGGLRNLALQRLSALEASAPPPTWIPPGDVVRALLRDTVLEEAPTAAAVASARSNLALPAPDLLYQVLDQLLEQALRVLIQRACSSTRFAADLGTGVSPGVVISGANLWRHGALTGPGTSVVAAGLADLRTPPAGFTPPRTIAQALTFGDPSHWDVLARDRLETLLDAWISGLDLPPAGPAGPAGGANRLARFRDELLPALLAAALVRTRGCRLALAAAMTRAQAMPSGELNDPDPEASPPSARALHSLADLGEGLASFLEMERQRGASGGLVPWGAYTPPADAPRLERVERNLGLLREHYAPLEAQLAEAGAEVAFLLRQRAETFEAGLQRLWIELWADVGPANSRPALSSLLALGVDLLEPPATGLLLLPGLGNRPGTSWATLSADVLGRYPAPGGTSPPAPAPQPVAEALVDSQLRRPRFDAHHIYTVQAWVRVAPRRQGEVERLIWSPRSEPFVLAEPGDLLGSQPQVVPLPDVGRLLRDLGRLRKAGANPFLTLVPPPRSSAESRGGLDGLRRDWGLGTPVALVAPVLAVVGLGMLSGALRTVSRLPGFAWMRQVVVRCPAPERRP